MSPIKLVSMSDIGSRLEHMSDLHELWSFALGVLTAGTYHSEQEQEQAKELEIALRLLESHMLCEYSPTTYAQVINNLPRKPEDIK